MLELQAAESIELQLRSTAAGPVRIASIAKRLATASSSDDEVEGGLDRHLDLLGPVLASWQASSMCSSMRSRKRS